MTPTEAAHVVSEKLSAIADQKQPTLQQIKAFLLACGYTVITPADPWVAEVWKDFEVYVHSSSERESLKIPISQDKLDRDPFAYARMVCHSISYYSVGSSAYWPVIVSVIADIEVE